jgi:phage terminase large subunit-like protein
MIENGFVYVPQAAPWPAPYLHELTAFPHGKHDDQVDSTAQMLDGFKGASREPGILGYYRMLAYMRDTSEAV